MNIREELLSHKLHGKEQALKIAEYAASSTKRFDELMKCFLEGEMRVTQRAAWSLSWAARKTPSLIVPHYKDLISQLQRKDVHDAVIRNVLRILEDVELPEEFHGEVMTACFEFIETHTSPIAIKAFSLTILHNLSKLYPEIKPELKLIIEDRWENETAAFKSRGRKILKKL